MGHYTDRIPPQSRGSTVEALRSESQEHITVQWCKVAAPTVVECGVVGAGEAECHRHVEVSGLLNWHSQIFRLRWLNGLPPWTAAYSFERLPSAMALVPPASPCLPFGIIAALWNS
jgi:hypothetical protein